MDNAHSAHFPTSNSKQKVAADACVVHTITDTHTQTLTPRHSRPDTHAQTLTPRHSHSSISTPPSLLSQASATTNKVTVEMSAPVDVFQLDLSLMPRFTMMQFAAQLGGLATFISGLISLAMVIVERELLYKLLMAVWISPLCWPCRKVAQTYKEKAAARKEAAKKAREARALAKKIAKQREPLRI